MADLEKHFFPGGGCKIHTYREGGCYGDKKCDHRSSAKPWKWLPDEAHHVLCVSSTVAYKNRDEYKDADLRATIDAAYWHTEWCVNEAGNIVWLPLKATYGGNSAGDPKAAVWGLDLPCHNQDHNCAMGYTDEVIAAMKGRVWDQIDAMRRKKPPQCPTEKFMQQQFQSVITKMKDEITRRGTRAVQGGAGTRAARKAQGTEHWWLPFSMAKDVVAKNRLVNTFGDKPRWARGFVRVRP
jgi:hypothetical protein